MENPNSTAKEIPARTYEELTQLLCGAACAGELAARAGRFTDAIPELIPMLGFAQHNPHHDKDVWRHTLAVVAAAPADPILRWAALLHDVGKPACFSLDAEGVGHFYGHAQQGAQIADEILARLEFDAAPRAAIVLLIRRHDTPVLPEEKPLRRLAGKLGMENARRLIALQRADTLGQAPACRARLPLLAQAEQMLEEWARTPEPFAARALAVNGDDLLALGLRGRAVGAALEACRRAVREHRAPNERAALLALVRQLAGTGALE